MSEPKIQVELTGESEFHCFRLIFQGSRRPIEIYLHTTQALDLFSKLGAAICEKAHQDAAELLRQKTGLTTEELVKRGLLAPTH